MKKILISLFLLFCLTGCSSLSQLPFIGVEKNIDEEVLYSKMNIPETVSFEIEDI
ncbi:MAG: hypothetical protein LBH96_00715 [Candidatus Peribacteria bacterium]|jgi:hypothetical protein|nr:hypothetical protein [Candidatus Peribacteria bacterium]